MNKIPLNVDISKLTNAFGETAETFETVMNFRRNYSKLRFFTGERSGKLCNSENLLLNLIKRLGGKVVCLSISLADGSEPLMLRLLKCVPNLIKLKITSYLVNENNKIATPVVLLNKLEEIQIPNDSLLRHIEAPAVKHLEFKGNSEKDLQNFLYRSPKLVHLKLGANIVMNSDYPFRLESIELEKSVDWSDITNIESFLLSQALTVRRFEAVSYLPNMQELVLLNFRRLEYLHTVFSYMNCNDGWWHKVRPLYLLKVIKSPYSIPLPLLGNCTELREISLSKESYFSSKLEFVMIHNRKLEVLRISHIEVYEGKFEFLTELELFDQEECYPLIVFLVAHPSIETLIIQPMLELADFILELNKTNLKKVLICGQMSLHRKTKQQWIMEYD